MTSSVGAIKGNDNNNDDDCQLELIWKYWKLYLISSAILQNITTTGSRLCVVELNCYKNFRTDPVTQCFAVGHFLSVWPSIFFLTLISKYQNTPERYGKERLEGAGGGIRRWGKRRVKKTVEKYLVHESEKNKETEGTLLNSNFFTHNSIFSFPSFIFFNFYFFFFWKLSLIIKKCQ